ncbi:GIY-YIG nuclease family protein [Noviherbaspirillum sp.]|uniref:GIY-YIG nuclease family protein n=1 Tax=Noviherbaspirillum sp. TaxID=1926288 RepID=UPI002DDD530F|nr:GIY-YIG nuclease family protein [Noviherbaspirillum sp.]
MKDSWLFGQVRQAMQYYVYILASQRNGTLYIGVTRDLVKRTWQHKSDIVESFTSRYAVHLLVWYEVHASIGAAITREKQLKKWNRDWKLRLIEETNPTWQDRYYEFTA